MTLKISVSGVRGTVPDSLTPEVCLDFAKAFGTYLGGGKVVVGVDSRRSSEFIKGIIFSGLLSAGCAVVDLGVCPTPTVGIMIRELRARGGIVVTASHNPLPWNGIKFMREDGIFLSESQGKRLLGIYHAKEFNSSPAEGVSADPSAIDVHIKKVLKTISPLPVRRKKFRVAFDGCNGAGSAALPRLLKKFGCSVLAINCEPQLPFPHPPEPVAENLDELCRLVKEKKADIGFAVDSDADRLAIVSDEGKAVGEELTLALAVKFILSKKSGNKVAVANLSTSMVIGDICREARATLIRTKVGEVHVAEELKSLKGAIGGEGNGGVIFPRVGYNRDSLSAAALILSYMAGSGKRLSRLVAELPRYEMVKTKIECRDLDEAGEMIEKTKEIFKGNDLILTEGVKVILKDAWIHVRPSNTEPIVRVIAEAKSEQKAKELVRQLLDSI